MKIIRANVQRIDAGLNAVEILRLDPKDLHAIHMRGGPNEFARVLRPSRPLRYRSSVVMPKPIHRPDRRIVFSWSLAMREAVPRANQEAHIVKRFLSLVVVLTFGPVLLR